ncbi:MAG TPA: hypothetical protein VGG72_21225 [Bryobacteraceae bacterium]|jgi:hypothetical protein
MLDQHNLHMIMGMMSIFAVFGIIMIAVVMIPYWFIWKKAGFSPWLSLIMLVPLGNIIMLYVLAFSDWKVVPVAQVTYIPPRP